MRNKLKNLVIFTFILVVFSCTNDIGINTNEQINDNTEIINDLKTNLIKDIDFNEIVNINYQFSEASIQKIRKYIINNGKINEPFDNKNYEEIFVVIGIDDLYKEHISNLKMLTQNIRTR